MPLNQYIWIGIVIGVFFVGIGVSYAIFSNTDNPSTMKFANQEIFDQMMSQNPKMMANWMKTMMQDEQFHNQAMDYMAKNPEQMNQWMVQDPKHVEEMSTAMKENHEFMMKMVSVILNDPDLRLQMMGHMTESQELMEMMEKMMGSGGMMGSGMMEGDEAKIRELISGYQIALNNEEIVLTYEYLFSQFDFELEFDIKEVVIAENFAYVLSNSEGTITLESSGTEETSKNQEIFILIKEGDDWKISKYMFNSI